MTNSDNGLTFFSSAPSSDCRLSFSCPGKHPMYDVAYRTVCLMFCQNSDLVLAIWSSKKMWCSKPTAPLSWEAPWGGSHCGGMGPCCSIDTSPYTQVVRGLYQKMKRHKWNLKIIRFAVIYVNIWHLYKNITFFAFSVLHWGIFVKVYLYEKWSYR